jgi:hypothetical protein
MLFEKMIQHNSFVLFFELSEDTLRQPYIPYNSILCFCCKGIRDEQFKAKVETNKLMC